MSNTQTSRSFSVPGADVPKDSGSPPADSRAGNSVSLNYADLESGFDSVSKSGASETNFGTVESAPETHETESDGLSPALEKRLRLLEERITFYEHGAEALSRASFEMEKQIQRLELQNRQLIAEIRRLRECLRDPFNPQLEKPPHY